MVSYLLPSSLSSRARISKIIEARNDSENRCENFTFYVFLDLWAFRPYLFENCEVSSRWPW